MSSWSDLLDQLRNHTNPSQFLHEQARAQLSRIGELRGDRHVILYATAFLQKPEAPPHVLQIHREDLNGFMAAIHGMDWRKNLSIVLHTPGGNPDAAETIVSYLRQKFQDIEVIVPAYAMSAGTMVALACNRIIMGRQSQLGPIDPSLGPHSALAVLDQFDQAKKDILEDQRMAMVWHPILQTIGPALLIASRNANERGERMVAKWLEKYMFEDREQAARQAAATASHFSDRDHKSHGRRIDRDEARGAGLEVVDLEDSQVLQESVLTLYHLATIIFEQGPASKLVQSDIDGIWVKNWQDPTRQAVPVAVPAAPQVR